MILRQCYMTDAMVIFRENRGSIVDWETLTTQIGGGVAWAAFAPGEKRPVAIGGVYDLGADGEAWFWPSPGRARPVMAGLLVAVRKALRMQALIFAGGLTCSVRDGHLPGERIAMVLGFSQTDDTDALGNRIWRMMMGEAVASLFGGQTKGQKQQQALLDDQKRKQNAVEQGQIATQNAGRGLLSFVDDKLGGATSLGMSTTLGGGR